MRKTMLRIAFLLIKFPLYIIIFLSLLYLTIDLSEVDKMVKNIFDSKIVQTFLFRILKAEVCGTLIQKHEATRRECLLK